MFPSSASAISFQATDHFDNETWPFTSVSLKSEASNKSEQNFDQDVGMDFIEWKSELRQSLSTSFYSMEFSRLFDAWVKK